MEKIESDTSDKLVSNFNKWFRITVGAVIIGAAIYYREWIPAIPGVVFVIQGILNRGCHGECYTFRKNDN